MGRLSHKKHLKFLRASLFIIIFLAVPPFIKEAQAACCVACKMCVQGDCTAAETIIETNHATGRATINNYFTVEMESFKVWMVNDFFLPLILPALEKFTEQLSAVAMKQILVFGMFLDAGQQLETQRLFQELLVQAHKDYQPSEDFCQFGTNVRSLAHSESVSDHNAQALRFIQLSRHLGNAHSAGAETIGHDKQGRWIKFSQRYCDPYDNGSLQATPNTGLMLACGALINGEQINIDVDYTRLIDNPRTIDVAFHLPPGPGLGISHEQEQDVLALSKNLYGHNILSRDLRGSALKNEQTQHLYLALRSIAAKRSVAENSYNAIVGMKAAGSSDSMSAGTQTREFLGAILAELGTPADEIYGILGEHPSYYAQLEVLAKKIYQNPDFYANLYDKPANVERKSVALRAIETMLDRAIYESQLRQEMATSVLLSSRLRPVFRQANRELAVEE